MEITGGSLGGIPVFRVVGEVDHGTAPLLRKRTEDALGTGATHLVLDLEDCTYMDSGGIAVLFDLLKTVRQVGWIGIVRPSRHVLRILDVVGLPGTPGFVVFSSAAEVEERCGSARRDSSGQVGSGGR